MTKKSLIASRLEAIEPFHVMDILARTRNLESQGRSIVHMEVGEPDFITPQPIINAGVAALNAGHTHYTPALGLPALRQAVSGFYRERYGVEVSADRVVITPGASGALQLALAALVNPGEQVLMADPGYPCNRHFVRLFDGVPVSLPVGPESAYQLNAKMIAENWNEQCKAVLLASPSNPTGTVLDAQSLQSIAEQVCAKGGQLIVDEIYHGLVYEKNIPSALQFDQSVLVINSFSKYFGMTGWRLGWLIAPEEFVPAIDRLAQNIFLAASTPAQYAALAAFEPDTLFILDERRDEFKLRRDYLLPALRDLGFNISLEPQGAFYLYADCSRFTDDSFQFCHAMLNKAGVAVTPGCDFGENSQRIHLRFAYTTSMEQLQEGVSRLKKFLYN